MTCFFSLYFTIVNSYICEKLHLDIFLEIYYNILDVTETLRKGSYDIITNKIRFNRPKFGQLERSDESV